MGYALEEIDNDITRLTPASFEPTIDYVVVKWPRFAFEKFPGAEGSLGTSMQSVGEAMAIGRTFKQAFAKAMRSRELDVDGAPEGDLEELLTRLETPSHDRYEVLFEALRRGASRGRGPPRAPASTPGSWPSWRRWPRATTPRRACSARSSRSTPAPRSSPPRRRTSTRAGSARPRTRSTAATGTA